MTLSPLAVALAAALACCFLAACIGGVAGLLGGMGGARLLRRAVAELGEDIASLDRRISRREGQAGREKRGDTPADPLLAQMEAAVRAGVPLAAVAPPVQPRALKPAPRRQPTDLEREMASRQPKVEGAPDVS